MNRIKLAEQIKMIEEELKFDPTALLNSEPEPEREHSLFVPLHYEKNYSYPLVVWLNESGASQRTFSRLMPQISMRNYVGISPACMDVQTGWQQEPQDILSAENAVADCIAAACDHYNIDSNRVFIAGKGDGGTMAYRIALGHRDWFAGVLSFGGAMPQDLTPLADFKRCRSLPCFVSLARECDQFDTETLCRQLKLMYSAGFDLTVRQYPDDPQLMQRVLHDMNVWIMELVTGQKTDSTQSASPSYIPGPSSISGNN